MNNRLFTRNSLVIIICSVIGLLSAHASFAIAPISGPDSICLATTTTYSDATAGGTWSISGSAYASIGSASGILTTWHSAGTVTITYTTGTSNVTKTVTVNAVPAVPHTLTFIGAGSYCTPPGGVQVILPVSDSGLMYIFAADGYTPDTLIGTGGSLNFGSYIGDGFDDLFYDLNPVTGCGSTDPLLYVLSGSPNPALIYGDTSVCFKSFTTLSDSIGGGTWSSSNTAIATIGTTSGILFAAGIGVVSITYSLAPHCPLIVTVYLCVSIADSPTYTGGFTFGGPDSTTTTFIPNTNSSPSITIYPNPATTSLTIQSTNNPITQIIITNLLSQTLYQQTMPASCKLLQVDVSPFPPGIYLLKINGPDSYREIRKFVKE